MDRLLIVGSGALACLFGAKLAASTEVTLLGTWREGLEAIQQDGIRLETADGTKVARVRATAEPGDLHDVEHALVLVKAWQTDQAADRLKSCLAANGLALTLQNGLGNLEILQSHLGADRAALGVTTVGATLLGPGHVRAGGEGALHLGQEKRLAPFWDMFKRAEFELKRADNLEDLVWGKLAVNAGINPLTALLRVRNGALLELPGARDVLARAVSEVAAVVAASGGSLGMADPVGETRAVAQRTAENRSSMLQDVLRGAPTEIDAICGAVVRRGRELDVPTPVNETLWQLVRAAAAREQE